MATEGLDVHIYESEHEATSTGLPSTKLAMWIFLASDCLLFGALIATYVLYRHSSVTGPFPKDVFDIPYTSVSSFVLLASSLTMVLALAAAQREDTGHTRLWLLPTAMIGLYWHFVDIVWIVIFTVVYLIPTPLPGGPGGG